MLAEGTSSEEKGLSEGVVSVSVIASCALLLQFQFRLLVSTHFHLFSYQFNTSFPFPFSFSMHAQIGLKSIQCGEKTVQNIISYTNENETAETQKSKRRVQHTLNTKTV